MEEMRRFKEFMRWHSSWWQSSDRVVTDRALQEGLHAYAEYQAIVRDALHGRAEYLWRFSNE